MEYNKETRAQEAAASDRERVRLKADEDAYVAWVFARTLWTSGSETRANIAVQEARYSASIGSDSFKEWRRLIQLNMGLSGMLDRLTGAPR